MDRLQSTIRTITNLSESLNKVQNDIALIQNKIAQQTIRLKNDMYLKNIDKQYSLDGSISNTIPDHEIDQEIAELKKQMNFLEKAKQLKQETMNVLLDDLDQLSFHSSAGEEDSEIEKIRQKHSETRFKKYFLYPTHSDNSSAKNDEYLLAGDSVSHTYSRENIETRFYFPSTSSDNLERKIAKTDKCLLAGDSISHTSSKENSETRFDIPSTSSDNLESRIVKIDKRPMFKGEVVSNQSSKVKNYATVFKDSLFSKSSSVQTSSRSSENYFTKESEVEAKISEAQSVANEPLPNTTYVSPALSFSHAVRMRKKSSEKSFLNTAGMKVEAKPSFSKDEWWKADKIDCSEADGINWEFEENQKEVNKLCLTVSVGTCGVVTTCDEIEKHLRRYTGNKIQWSAIKSTFREADKTPMMIVKFKNLVDRQIVLAMRSKISRDGYIIIGETFNFPERKERRRMQEKALELQQKGHHVYFENRRICVDGKWWKYCLGQGWQPL